MTEFQEDMLFKNISEEDAQTILEIMEKNSENVKIWTKELRLLDPTSYKPDLILELDDENLIIEFQSTAVNDQFSRRAHVYVAITDLKKENDKEVNLEVFSSAESSKEVVYKVNKSNTFVYNVRGFERFDGEKIINSIEEKFNNNQHIIPKESIYLSLAPIMDKYNNVEKNIQRVVNLLIKLDDLPTSTKNLSYGIEWLLTDKYVKDKKERNILLDLLGDRMSAIYEYGERKQEKGEKIGEQNGIKKTIKKLHKSGMTISEISEKLETEENTIKKIINDKDN